jgi:transposase
MLFRSNCGSWARVRSHLSTWRIERSPGFLRLQPGGDHASSDRRQWAKFEAAIAAVEIRGARPRKEDRRTIEAIIWRLDNGAKWRSIPAKLGNWHHAYLRFRRWGRTWSLRVSRSWHSPASMTRLLGRTKGGRSAPEQTDDVSLRFNRSTGCNRPIGKPLAVRGAVLAVKSSGFAMPLAALSTLSWRAGSGARAGSFVAAVDTSAQGAGVGRRGMRREGVPFGGAGDEVDPGCAVTQERQAARTVSRLHIPAPQPDRTLLVTPEGMAGNRTRYEKTAIAYAAGIAIAAMLDWFKSSR